MEHLKVSSCGSAPALSTNIRLGWKGLPGKNALAYFEKSKLTAVKSFITLTPRSHQRMHLKQLLSLIIDLEPLVPATIRLNQPPEGISFVIFILNSFLSVIVK